MSTDRLKIREIFDQARHLPRSARAAFLDGLTGLDPAARAQIEDMLAALDDAGQFLAQPTQDQPAGVTKLIASPQDPTIITPLREGPGTRIGPYKLLQVIGEGGFGTVFLAEQERPVVRKVALKIIKLGMDTRQVVARFEQERQALAMMDHPSIAKVLDAGATETGRPYFVMELVKGEPIVEYCDRQSLSIQQRLELFAQVCAAVQHAHTKGIIHRDIKPSNILVSTQDGRPHAKVIDFGIAKATASKLTEKTLFTEHRQLIGTPEYMSPEQAEGSLDIDTRTDVYSLGVLLYELLTGTTPFSGSELRSAAYAEIQRIIREVEPPKPSTRLSANADTIASVAAKRQTEPKRLGSTVRGELDWIVMKALEKDRQRRYETASGLALDIRRYLAGEAVNAAPPSAVYRFKKFVRRNRAIVTSGSAVAAALLIGVVAFAWQAHVARAQRDRAVSAEAQTAQRAEQLRTVAEFQAGMLEQIDPTNAGIKLMKDIRENLDAALAQAKPPITPEERSRRVGALEGELRNVNATDAARQMIDRTILKPAIAAIDAQFKDQPAIDAQLRQTLAIRYQELGLYESALPLQTSALATRQRLLGDEHPDTLASQAQLGSLLHAQGKLQEAELATRGALEKRQRLLGANHADTLTSMSNLALVLQSMGKPAEAEKLHRETLVARRKVLGDNHPDTLGSISNVGFALSAQGKMSESEPFYREALERMRRVRGEEHPDTLLAINNLGFLLQGQGKNAEAEPLFRECLDKRRRYLGDEHPNTLNSVNNLGMLLQALGKLAEAEPYIREALDKRRRVLGDDHPTTIGSINNVGLLLRAQGRLDAAEPYLREAMEKYRRVVGPEHPSTVNAINNLAAVCAQQGKHREVLDLLEPIEELAHKSLTGAYATRLVRLLINLGQARAALAKDDPTAWIKAEANLLEAHSICTTVRGPTHADTRLCAKNIADFYAAWNAADPAKGHDAKSAEWRDKSTPPQSPSSTPTNQPPTTQPK